MRGSIRGGKDRREEWVCGPERIFSGGREKSRGAQGIPRPGLHRKDASSEGLYERGERTSLVSSKTARRLCRVQGREEKAVGGAKNRKSAGKRETHVS